MLKVVDPGFYTTIQDFGRRNWRHKGVPVSGTMDDLARHWANSLLDNPPDAVVLEITMTGPTLEFGEDSFICIGGGEMSPALNGTPLNTYQVYKVTANDVLSFGRLTRGFRTYLAIKGGFQAERILGSASQYFPLTPQSTVAKGEEIPYEPISQFVPKISQIKTAAYMDSSTIEVSEGPEMALLSAAQKKMLFEMEFTISKENNRMAYQLVEKIGSITHSMLTSAVLPGTVQMTPEGQLLILMKDGQTTGGYLRVLQLSTRSIAILAQKKFGDKLRFSTL